MRGNYWTNPVITAASFPILPAHSSSTNFNASSSSPRGAEGRIFRFMLRINFPIFISSPLDHCLRFAILSPVLRRIPQLYVQHSERSVELPQPVGADDDKLPTRSDCALDLVGRPTIAVEPAMTRFSALLVTPETKYSSTMSATMRSSAHLPAKIAAQP
jgi:hypothetical protein